MPVKNVISHLWSADFSLSGRVLAVYGTYAGSQPANYSPKSFPRAWGKLPMEPEGVSFFLLLLVDYLFKKHFLNINDV